MNLLQSIKSQKNQAKIHKLNSNQLSSIKGGQSNAGHTDPNQPGPDPWIGD